MKFKQYLLEQDDFSDWDVTSDETGEDIAWVQWKMQAEKFFANRRKGKQGYGMHVGHILFNRDYTISVEGDVILAGRGLKKIPFNFKTVSGHFQVDSNELTTLEGCPEYVGGHFSCADNHDLKSLVHGPKRVEGIYYCDICKLETMEGCAEYIGKSLFCNDNHLKSLKGCPEAINSEFDCSDNILRNLEDGPKVVLKDYYCMRNQYKPFSKKYIQSICRVGGDIYV